jgi:PAS domain S-box-containing protein
VVTASQPKVLIVDDQPRNLDVLEAMLADTDCTLVRASSPEDALLAIVRHDFAALVLDIRMPGMTGIELATLIKQRKRSRHVPILFLTAHLVNDQDVLKGYGAGAVDYMSKPVNAEILRSKIGVFVQMFRTTRALEEVNAALHREIAERLQAQSALEAANQELELRVQERTAALNRAHQGVRENEERLRMALDVAQIAAWEWHLASGQMRWSADPEVLFGFAKGSFGNDLRIARVVHPEDRSRLQEATLGALQSGIYEAEFRAVRPEGAEVWITERGRVFSDVDGDRMVGISRDVTAERAASQERERLLRSERAARDEAERQSRLKDEFLATLSHELRTPMNIILGWVDALAKGVTVRDSQDVVLTIQRNARIQARLIDDLLDMNRLLAGNLKIDTAPVDLAETLEAAVRGLQPAAEAKGITLISAAEGPVTIMADSRRLHQVFWNLLHNAIKFTPKGGRVEARVAAGAGHVTLVVSDSGFGISPQFLPHVFERFRQEDSSTTREAAGLGLGLSISKHLVELHGGTIRAFSEGPSRGTTFTVELPAADADSLSTDAVPV